MSVFLKRGGGGGSTLPHAMPYLSLLWCGKITQAGAWTRFIITGLWFFFLLIEPL